MKKLFFTLTIIAFSAGGVFAQGISGGLKVGANFANQKFSGDGLDISPDSRTSMHLGLFLTAMVSETFGIQPELMYNSVGSKFDLLGNELLQKLDYLTIPVMLRYQPVSVFHIHAGPQFGLLLSAKSEYDGDSQDTKEDYKGMDLGVGIGAGVDLPMGLGISARYVMGLSNIAESEDPDEEGTLKNNAIQLSITYKIFGK
ncbi:MAG: porin family protein [Cyclobacteriaceae bacterium]